MTNRKIDMLVAEKVMGIARVFKTFNTAELYSTDPVASKQLRDKMRADGWHWTATAMPDGDFYFCFVSRSGGDGHAYAATEELAVALAALKAVGVEPLAGGSEAA